MEVMDAMDFALKYAPEMLLGKRNQEDAPETAAAAPDVYAQIAAMIREAEAARQEALRQADAAEAKLRKIREQLEELAAMSGGSET